MIKIIIFISLTFLIFSCGDNDSDNMYNSHNIILPNNIDLDSTLISIQLEAADNINEYFKEERLTKALPHPIIKDGLFSINNYFEYSQSIVQIVDLKNQNPKQIYSGKLSIGESMIYFNMNKFFEDKFGFYKIQVLNYSKVVLEHIFYYSNGIYIFKNNESENAYISVLFIPLDTINPGNINFTSKFNDFENKYYHHIGNSGIVYGAYKFKKNVRIAILKPYENSYIELFAKTISYNEQKKLKEIIFTESDKIEN